MLKERALEFFIQENVLKFGDFTLKNGRKSPYFFNTGGLCSARQLSLMGQLYAEKLQEIGEFREADVIFGSAYKGIPISVATAMALADSPLDHLRAVSDRKEVKTHGDVSAFLGVLNAGDKVVLVDDVITDGATKLDALDKLTKHGCTSLGFIIAFDRAEKGKNTGELTAKGSFEQQTGLPVYPLISVDDVAALMPEFSRTLADYRASF